MTKQAVTAHFISSAMSSKQFTNKGPKKSYSTYKCGQHVMVDSSWSVVKLVLQGSRDGCSADRLGGSQGRLLGVKDWRLSCHYATRGCAGGRGRVRWGWRGARLTQGSVLTLSICWDAEGQGRGLKVPATTFPPARHILEREGVCKDNKMRLKTYVLV